MGFPFVSDACQIVVSDFVTRVADYLTDTFNRKKTGCLGLNSRKPIRKCSRPLGPNCSVRGRVRDGSSKHYESCPQ